MHFRKFSSPDSMISVEVDLGAVDTMIEACRKSLDKETGGILVGRYSDRETIAHISETLLASHDSVGTRGAFFRGTKGLSNKLRLLWSERASHYVGEWHYHPLGNGQPSDTDTKQMVSFAREEAMQTQVPIMIVVFRSEKDLFRLRTFVFTREAITLELTRCEPGDLEDDGLSSPRS